MLHVSTEISKDEFISEQAAKRLKLDNSVQSTGINIGKDQQEHSGKNIIPPSVRKSLTLEEVAEKKENTINSSEFKEIITKYICLPEFPNNTPQLPQLSNSERMELELALQLDFDKDSEDAWHEDWSGNLALMNKDISNPLTKRRKPHKTEITLSLLNWAQQRSTMTLSRRLGRNLLAYVYSKAPPMAKKIISHMSQMWDLNPIKFDINESLKRCSYDPKVLHEDGWTTGPSSLEKPQGLISRGAMEIGKHIEWQGYEAVVIAYVHDNDIGDLWKAMWLDGFETFDLEAEELQAAARKLERKNQKKNLKMKKVGRPKGIYKVTQTSESNGHTTGSKETIAVSSRFAAINDFDIRDIEYGVVMARTYHPNARQSLFWPARVMHASELDVYQSQRKRSSSKNKVNVVFLAPYWHNDNSMISVSNANGVRVIDYSSLPLFEMESIDVTKETIMNYTLDCKDGINFNKLKSSFKFTGLPKGAFCRFINAHRLALALQMYAKQELPNISARARNASAGLFAAHPLTLDVPRYPIALLHLPFEFILSNLRSPSKEANTVNGNETIEPTIHLGYIMKSMEPPLCYGKEVNDASDNRTQSNCDKIKQKQTLLTIDSPICKELASRIESSDSATATKNVEDYFFDNIMSDFIKKELTQVAETDLSSAPLLENLRNLIARCKRVIKYVTGKECVQYVKIIKLRSLLQECLRNKSYGEDVLAADASLLGREIEPILTEWRKACERIFKIVTVRCSSDGFGNGVTVVLSDSRCNQHITKDGCVERPVRLPVALKAAKNAGAGSSASFPLLYGVEDYYIKLATDKFLEKAHTVSYLKKMRTRCAALTPDIIGVHLTEGSNGEGGLDTTGTKGTFDAAVAAVGAAMKAVDMIVGGQCVNAFCATRPPGHHAGRNLHSMGAVSNGFCILNPVACAAIYATTPLSQGGLGLKRAVVIDFDVHHGNGTQDILCSTYDPRFLYISMHAGGAKINGYDSDNSEEDILQVGNKKQEGIFPGRCGDSSPHKGVVNIPLGPKVKPHDVGTAFTDIIEPSVAAFSPDIIILSAGFDGHKNDPLNLGGLSAQDFGHITEVACGMAFRFCSGRIFSVLEGGYGIPCCRPQKDIFLPQPEYLPQPQPQQPQPTCNAPATQSTPTDAQPTSSGLTNVTQVVPTLKPLKRPQPSKLLKLGDLLPDWMDDQVTPGIQRKLEKCHQEGFIDCVREHVASLKINNSQS